ncbi:MAG: flippase-like domain-containing protein, partial [Calditrichia bacterium]|nr:flippase-like domain-containing protein [Calditrichia bacterium]
LLDRLKNTRFKFSQYLKEEAGEDQDVKYNLKKVIPGLPIILTSALAIQLLSSFAIFIFIKALNYDLPYYIPMFITPVMFFIFLLPISFGSLGIREGAFIFFYGIFGMDQEAALLLSFLALSGRLLNVIIGAIILQVSSVKKIIE